MLKRGKGWKSKMINYINSHNQKIEYTMRINRRSRNLRIAVHRDGRVTLTRPFFISAARAHFFLQEKSPWILKQQEHFRSQPTFTKPTTRRDYLRDREKARLLILERLEYFNHFYNF